eukprot:scaffold4620_cov58-Phaeocystis_antarctica.AAC.4
MWAHSALSPLGRPLASRLEVAVEGGEAGELEGHVERLLRVRVRVIGLGLVRGAPVPRRGEPAVYAAACVEEVVRA